MRLPHVRFTVRRMMVAVVLVALSLVPAIVAIDIERHITDEDWRDGIASTLLSIQMLAGCGSLVLASAAICVIWPTWRVPEQLELTGSGEVSTRLDRTGP
jgi:hypothetical protein